MKENILLKIHQHWVKALLEILKYFLISSIFFWIFTYIISESIFITIVVLLIILVLIYSYFHFFHSKSYFYITNDKLSIDVRNWIFSKYNLSIHFDQIKDMAYSKNHIFHYLFDYWVLFVRSSAWSDWNFIVPDIPNIEDVFKKVNFLYSLSKEQRKNITSLDNLSDNTTTKNSKEDTIKKVKDELLKINWIVEVELLNNDDKKFIFETEEDRNHWVYECIKREITFVVTHNSSFRNADEPIVLKLWNKVIFPPVSFHEIKQKNTISSSPWIKVHNYLIKKLNNIWEYDATLLIWFDL